MSKNIDHNPTHYDVCIVGAGASGLMCAIEAARRGRRVLIMERADKAAKKILISGGGRCNFTNLNTSPDNFISDNPHFCKSALARYSPWDFIQLLDNANLSWNEKAKGQLFCDQKAPAIAQLLLDLCDTLGVTIKYSLHIENIHYSDDRYHIKTSHTSYQAQSFVVACGGPSIPKMGATDFALTIATQFKQANRSFIAALVPFTANHQQTIFNKLSGISLPVSIHCNNMTFTDQLLITHRGFSGPAVLQISSYWKAGNKVTLNLLPHLELTTWLIEQQDKHPLLSLYNTLNKILPKRLSHNITHGLIENSKLNQLNEKAIKQIAAQLHHFTLVPTGTEGFRTAEVSTGGVSTSAISSKTFESLTQPQLYFIGESIDVTGQLGGYNFQWAWASGWCAGQYA